MNEAHRTIKRPPAVLMHPSRPLLRSSRRTSVGAAHQTRVASGSFVARLKPAPQLLRSSPASSIRHLLVLLRSVAPSAPVLYSGVNTASSSSSYISIAAAPPAAPSGYGIHLFPEKHQLAPLAFPPGPEETPLLHSASARRPK